MAVFVPALSATAGTTAITIQVKTPPDINPAVFRKVAVLPFDGERDYGALAAKTVRERIEGKGLFLIEPPESVERAIDGDGRFQAGNREEALKVGQSLGADLVIYGEIKFYSRTYSPQGDIRNELYTADRQNMPYFEFGSDYATQDIDVNYNFTVELVVKALDVKSGRLVRRREFERTTTQSYTQSEVSTSTAKQDEIFKDLLTQVINDFVYTLDTHDVAAERLVVTF